MEKRPNWITQVQAPKEKGFPSTFSRPCVGGFGGQQANTNIQRGDEEFSSWNQSINQPHSERGRRFQVHELWGLSLSGQCLCMKSRAGVSQQIQRKGSGSCPALCRAPHSPLPWASNFLPGGHEPHPFSWRQDSPQRLNKAGGIRNMYDIYSCWENFSCKSETSELGLWANLVNYL